MFPEAHPRSRRWSALVVASAVTTLALVAIAPWPTVAAHTCVSSSAVPAHTSVGDVYVNEGYCSIYVACGVHVNVDEALHPDPSRVPSMPCE